MITRIRALFLLILSASAIAVACQRVPLLAPSGSSITLTTTVTTLPLNGTAGILAQVIEPSGTPPQHGTHIIFTTSLGSVQPSEAETDINGQVTVMFNAGTASGTASILASSGGAISTGAIKIAVGAAAVGHVSVSANPITVPAQGGKSTIVATVSDVNGTVLPSVPVTFTTTAGSFSATVVNSDTSGNAQTTLTTNKTSTVTATAGIQGSSSTTTPCTPVPPATTCTPTGSTSTSQSGTVTITLNSSPTITIGTPVPATPTVGQSVTFPLSGYSTDPASSPVQSVTVDFGDGTPPVTVPGKPASVSHTYTTIGSYSVRATITDAEGDTSTATGSVNVGGLGSVTVGAPSPTSPAVGQAVTFPVTVTATGSPITRVVADFGDGTAPTTYPGSTSAVSHIYNSGGTFAVRVTAFDAFGNSAVGGTSVLVSSRAQPTVTITTTTTNPTAGSDVTFTASVTPATGSGTNITSVTVDFGDGNTTNLGPVTGASIAIHHVYAAAGTYTVVLTATDSNGGVGTATTTVFVQAGTPLAVTVNFTKTIVDASNTRVDFTATVSGLGNAVVTSYDWNFGDGTTATTFTGQVSHNYAHPSTPPTLVATVTIHTSSGGSTSGSSTSITP